MREAGYITAVIVFGTFGVTWTLGRIVERWREPLGVVGGLVTRCGLGVLLVLTAVGALSHGGYWLALVPLVLVPALWNFVITAGIIWAWPGEEPSA